MYQALLRMTRLLAALAIWLAGSQQGFGLEDTLVIHPQSNTAPDFFAECPQLRELDPALKVAERLAETIRDTKLVDRIVLTRKADYLVTWRERMAETLTENPVTYVSLHLERSPSNVTHGLTLYGFLPSDDVDSLLFESTIKLKTLESVALDYLAWSQRLLTELELEVSQLQTTSVRVLQGPYLNIMGVRGASVDIGLGFITNQGDCERLSQRPELDELAQKLGDALSNYLKSSGGGL